MVTVVIQNLATVVTDAQVQGILPALQTQLDRDLCPSWHLGGFHLEFRAKGAAIAKGEAQFLFLDNTSDASALGFHDVTANGDPIAYVGVKETMDDGGNWTVTASHELCELAVNPTLNASEYDDKANRFYIAEVCDAVEADELGYQIDGVQVSDFVLPGWFDADVTPTARLSFRGNVSKPFELAAGGYISFLDLSKPSNGWQQTFAETPAHAPRTRPGTSRGTIRERVRQFGTPRKSAS